MSDTAQSEQHTPLAGIRVLELGNYIAAPTAGRLLADFGAEVIKIERPGTGDEVRRWRLPRGSTSMLFRTLNRHKRSVALDLRSPAGREAVLALAARSDVVIENFRPGTLEKWGLGPAQLEAANPDLVLCRISAFGQTGPLSSRPGFAAVAEAYGGLRELVGDPDRPPVRVGVSIGDSIAGIYAAFGAVMELFARQSARLAGRRPPRLGDRVVDVALNESILSVMESLLPDADAYGTQRTRTGGRMEGIAPSNAYVCGDGRSVVIAGNGDSIFARLMDLIGRPDLRDDPALAANDERWRRREELDAAIGEWTAARPQADVLADLAARDIPAGPIYTAADIAADEQYAARNMVQRRTASTGNEELEGIAFPGIVPVYGGRSGEIGSLGPELGADTRAVLTEVCGMDAAQLQRVLP
ncbi:CoA transferase [Brevibacterium sp. 5221]|uniref:CoA transferase n=1 Tax=Brevibacterium rongguiense TaxID=2695267 RepID=A0A6N9H8F6_9MICO|nr:CoA transferase [Brevibacterium rongguiense]MYM20347.1 CoA transferase [Brevibacterium rongguiense]